MKYLSFAFISLIFFLFFINIYNPSIVWGQNSLEDYCRNGAYYLNGVACGRAPNCGGVSYDQANAIDYRTVNQCWDQRCNRGMCQGEVPLCCYELERTGDPMMCNWPERGYCHQTQCAKVDPQKALACNGGSGDCNCGDPLIGWCCNIPVDQGGCKLTPCNIAYLSLSQRLGGANPTNTPTVTPTPIPPTSTRTPTPTSTITPRPTASATPSPTSPISTNTPTPTQRITSTPTSTVTATPILTIYPTTGPGVLPRITPNPYPPEPNCPFLSTCINKNKGDADCNGVVDNADYIIWKRTYDTIPSGSTANPNANFSCREGDRGTHFVDLADFEVYRRNASSFSANLPSVIPTNTAQSTPAATQTPTPTIRPTTPTSIPTTTPTASPTPTAIVCAQTSSNNYSLLSVNPPHPNTPAGQHPDYNLLMRGFSPTGGQLSLVDYDGGRDNLAPQLYSLLGKSPNIKSVYRVYDWNWANNQRGNLISSPEVTLIGLSANPRDNVMLPNSGYRISGNYQAIVLYADERNISLKYSPEDSVANGYTLHITGLCTDPNLLTVYRQQNTAGRNSLPALLGTQIIGTASSDEIKVAIRDTGSFMDPRSRKDWWQGY